MLYHLKCGSSTQLLSQNLFTHHLTYGKAALGERSCRQWFQKFKNGEFDIEDKERRGRSKVYEDAELEALLDQDSCETQEEKYDGQYFE